MLLLNGGLGPPPHPTNGFHAGFFTEATLDPLNEPGVAAEIERWVRLWHAIEPPNAPAERLAAQLTETIEAYARLRAPPALEEAPGDFAATLSALRDEAWPVAPA